MRIFADHCVHTDVITALRQQGFVVERASEAGLAGAPDDEIFKYAFETNQILLTFDYDFGNIIRFSIQQSQGVVIVYTYRLSADVIIKLVLDFFNQAKQVDLQGKLWLVEPGQIRIWPSKS